MNEKPKLDLTEVESGNAFAVLGAAVMMAKKSGWSAEKIAEYERKAKSGDYDNLLQVTMDYFDVE